MTKTEYDQAGQLISVIDPMRRTSSYAYDNLGRLITATEPDPDEFGPQLAARMTYAHDVFGAVLTATDRLNQVTSSAYDGFHRLQTSTDANGDPTGYTYDPNGNRLTLTDAESNTTSWVYDALNRVTAETNELNKTRSFEYDANSRLAKQTDRNARVTEYFFDDLGRLTEERWKSGGSTLRNLNFAYDSAGQLTGADDSDSSGRDYDYLYDELGRLEETQWHTPSRDYWLTNAYDADSRRTGRNFDFQESGYARLDYLIDVFTYDALDRLTRVTQAGYNEVARKRADFTYNLAGQLAAINRYGDLAGTSLMAASTYGYDGAGRLIALDHTRGSTVLAGYDYVWDAADRITSFTSSQYSTENATYDYDAAGQLEGANRTGTSADETYTYDDNGNRTNTGYSTGTNNRLTGDGTFTYTYDDEGNRLTKTRISSATVDDKTVEYSWDHRNRLTGLIYKNNAGTISKTVGYAYDHDNLLLGSTIDPDGALGSATLLYASHIWDGTQLLMSSYSDSGHHYLYGPGSDLILFDEQYQVELRVLLGDHLNTVRDAVDAAGNVDKHVAYNAFGAITGQTGSAVIHIGFTGRLIETAVGLNYHKERWYDPTVGRWISEDPIKDGTNWNAYVSNQVTTHIDPSGLAELRPSDITWPGRDPGTMKRDLMEAVEKHTGYGRNSGAVKQYGSYYADETTDDPQGLLNEAALWWAENIAESQRRNGVDAWFDLYLCAPNDKAQDAIAIAIANHFAYRLAAHRHFFTNPKLHDDVKSGGLLDQIAMMHLPADPEMYMSSGSSPRLPKSAIPRSPTPRSTIGQGKDGIKNAPDFCPAPRGPLQRGDVVLSGGRSGQNVKSLVGPPTSAVRGGSDRIFITNDKGQVILDITRDRVKPVTPGQGFGPKRPPTQDELLLLEQLLRGRS